MNIADTLCQNKGIILWGEINSDKPTYIPKLYVCETI